MKGQTCRACGSPEHNIRGCTDPRAVELRGSRVKYRSEQAVQRRRGKRTKVRAKIPREFKITPAALREEGVIEIGRATGCVLFVLTEVKLHLFHKPELLDERDLDEYGARQAIHLLEEGFTAKDVAARLGISPKRLEATLADRGYERFSLSRGTQSTRGRRIRHRDVKPANMIREARS